MNIVKSIAAVLVTAVTINATAIVPANSAPPIVQPKHIGMAIIGAGSANCQAKLRISVVAEAPGMVPIWLQKQGGPAIGPIWLEAKALSNGKNFGKKVHTFTVVGPHDEKYRAFNGGVSSKWAKYKSKNC